MALLGHGNGFSFEASPYCSYATRDGVHVILAGEVSDWPGISAVAAAHDGEQSNSMFMLFIVFFRSFTQCCMWGCRHDTRWRGVRLAWYQCNGSNT